MTNATECEAVVVAEVPARPERVFRALTSSDVTKWWVRPGVFDTREWSGDVRVGGNWRASGIARGNQYTLEGQFVEVAAPSKLVHTWKLAGAPLVSTVTYELQPTPSGTRITLHHGPFPSEEACAPNRIGWETSFDALVQLFGDER